LKRAYGGVKPKTMITFRPSSSILRWLFVSANSVKWRVRRKKLERFTQNFLLSRVGDKIILLLVKCQVVLSHNFTRKEERIKDKERRKDQD